MIAFEPALNTFQDVVRQWPDSVRDRLDAAVAAAAAARRAVQTETETRAYCRRVRDMFWQSLGGLPVDQSPVRDGGHDTHGTLTHLGVSITKLTYESFPGVPVSALLYRSDAAPAAGRKRGAVVFLCGHYSQAKVAAEFQRVCLDLALHGLVVLCIDPLGQGERYQYAVAGRETPDVPPGTFEHSYCGLQCLLTGGGVARYFAWDAVRAVDVLASLPDVDSTRIGATGNSGGGVQTVYLMLADERLAAAMPCTYVTGLSAFYRTGQPLDAELCPAGTLANGIDHADMLLGFAPKPLLVGAAAYDYFPIEATEQSVVEARRLYALLGAEQNVGLAVSQSLHHYSDELRAAAVRFFTRVLDGRERYEPREISALPESELVCSLTGQLYRDRPAARGVYDLNREFLAARRHPQPATAGEAAERLTQALGPMPALDATPIRPRYFAPKAADGYTAQQVFFWSEPAVAVAGTLLRPHTVPREAARTWLVLLPHGTASSETALTEAIEIARSGETIFVFDPRGRGAVKSAPLTLYAPYDSWLGQEGWTSYVEMLSGHTALATRVYDVRRAVSFLEQFESAQGKVAVRGHGIAALWGYIAGALDDRVRTAHFTNLLPSWQEVVDTRLFDSDTITAAMVLPAALQHFDLPDLRQCYAGRSLTLETPLRVQALPEQLPLKRNAVPSDD
jgi:cephalosporin-C deacetylase-like acetyl esterase